MIKLFTDTNRLILTEVAFAVVTKRERLDEDAEVRGIAIVLFTRPNNEGWIIKAQR